MDSQIALVDDHRLFRSGIASLIQKIGGYRIIFEASNGEELIGKIKSGLVPDIILLDINMPLMNGIDTANWLRGTLPEIKVIVLSMFDDPDKVLAMLKLGIKGYLLKDAEPHEFEHALQRVSHNDVYYPDFVTKYLLDTINPNVDHSKLNSRELEFLKLAGSELTYKEIADQMKISVRTVDGYRDQLFEKLHVKSRVGLVLYAIKNKLIDL
ncbi:MAG TPA: response regulator transcription factor [Mucilaginibacter sp.]|jgi:DNA-binding NarL/FixJ family response regulator|nr:response regulator transcription factor [Mucilaginibacter sp.]